MALCEISFFSQSLQKMSGLNVILPEKIFPGPYSVFYLLHGLSDDHTAWTRRTSIERYAQDYPILVVMPDGGRGFYTDAKEGPAYESHVIKDVIGFVERTFNVKPAREGRAIGGLSMGGYGALKLGFKYPGLFCSVNSHSGAPGFARRTFNDETKEFLRIFGLEARGGPEDPFALAEKAEIDRLPQIRIDCGTEDFLLEDNREFHTLLQKLKIPHEYEEYPGFHDWGYWDQHVQSALMFHLAGMGIDAIR
jgi:S-formylglutathione hydrolase FrmB